MGVADLRAISIMWRIFASIIVFLVWIQVWNPIVNDYVIPYVTNADNSIAYASLIQVLLSFVPLLMVLAILLIPIFETQPQQYYIGG